MKLEWTAPTSDGGDDITDYIIEKKDRFSPRWTKVTQVSSTDTCCEVDGLKEGNEYQFRVIGVNRAGTGKPSESSKPTVAKSPYGKFFSYQTKSVSKFKLKFSRALRIAMLTYSDVNRFMYKCTNETFVSVRRL